MTEADWLACDDSAAMLKFLASNVSRRKVRLFAAAACRRVHHMVEHPAAAAAILLAERLADGGETADDEEREAAEAAAWAVWREFRRPASARNAAATAARAVGDDDDFAGAVAEWVCNAAGFRAAESAPRSAKESRRAEAKAAEQRHPCTLLREVVGNPFRPVMPDPAWRTSTALALASGVYDDRAFDRLPILADALEEAGCDSADLLAHCRGGGEHVRGCWAVDLVLGRE